MSSQWPVSALRRLWNRLIGFEIAKSGGLLVGSPVSERTPVDASGSAPGPSHARADDLASRSRCTHCLRSLPLMLICSGKCTSLDGGVRPGRRNDPTVIQARGCRCSLDDSRTVPYCIPLFWRLHGRCRRCMVQYGLHVAELDNVTALWPGPLG